MRNNRCVLVGYKSSGCLPPQALLISYCSTMTMVIPCWTIPDAVGCLYAPGPTGEMQCVYTPPDSHYRELFRKAVKYLRSLGIKVGAVRCPNNVVYFFARAAEEANILKRRYDAGLVEWCHRTLANPY